MRWADALLERIPLTIQLIVGGVVVIPACIVAAFVVLLWIFTPIMRLVGALI